MSESWIQSLTIIGANFGFMLAMFLWLRSEANAVRRDNVRMIFDLTTTLIAESKDFHGRLSQIEERNRK
jgi:hypothetical protein